MKNLGRALMDPKVMNKVLGGTGLTSDEDETDQLVDDEPEDDETQDQPEDLRTLTVWVNVESGTDKRKKVLYHPPRGPVDCTLASGFNGFLQAVAEAVEVATYRLEAKSITYKPESPARAMPYPIQNQKGFDAMVKAVFKKSSDSEKTINIYMKPPKKKNTVPVCLRYEAMLSILISIRNGIEVLMRTRPLPLMQKRMQAWAQHRERYAPLSPFF
jgi:hypothetical protein